MSPLRFSDRDEALRFLGRNLGGTGAMADVRCRFSSGAGASASDAAFLRRLADDIQAGQLRVERLDRPWDERAGVPEKPEPPKPAPPGPSPKPKPQQVAELVVTVKTLDGKPVDKALVSAGAIGSRHTGADGVADFGTVTSGTYDITAEKDGHGKTRNGPICKDEKKAVAVPLGSRTAVNLVQHPDCANVAFFEGSTTRANYFGFDHKTNLKPAGGNPYWDPVPAKGSLSLPGRLTRDEARWVSVAVGQETEVEINFAFKDAECIPCIGNCTFVVVPGNVAEVITAHVTAKKASFRIKGKAKGEASLKVICDGKDIGWFHIWCEVAKELLVDVACIVTTRTSVVAYDISGLTTYMNEIFRQMLISLNLKDLGTIDLSGNAALATVEGQSYPAGKLFQEDTDGNQDTVVLTALDDAAMAQVAARTTGPTGRNGARRLYWYVPNVGAQWGGMNLEIGHPATFIFFGESVAARNTGAHEIGHSIRLRHPLHDGGAGQFCAHNLATLNQPVPAFDATNTEPATAIASAKANVMANDPTNLMGYWHDKASRKYLRYHQWIATDRS